MKFELARLIQYDDESMIPEIKRVAGLVPADVKLTAAQFDLHAKVSSSAIRRRFGGWRNALRSADLADRYSGRSVSSKMRIQAARDMTDQQLTAELQQVASEIKSKTLTVAQFNAHSEIAASAISRRLGSWNKALQAAGLQPVSMGRRYTEEDYFENLLNVWTHLGRQPKYGEMNAAPSAIPSGAYENRWGTWRKALIAFVQRVNTDSDLTKDTQPLEDKSVLEVAPRNPNLQPEDQRKIPLGLRYNVLVRDHFKCVLCGNSPATDPGCKLHVDHILPFSKNGKTFQENLRTLCGACNIGKSNRIETIQQFAPPDRR
jgi:hypothetical protein